MLFASTGLTGRGAAILSTPSYHAAVRPDGHAFKSDRWEECVQMPAKMARSAPRPPFGPPEVTVAVRTSLLSCRKAGKPRTSAPIRESSGESRLKGFDQAIVTFNRRDFQPGTERFGIEVLSPGATIERV